MSLPKLAARPVLGYVGVVEGTAALIRDMERVSLEEKLIVSGALGIALAAAFWPERRR